MSNNSNIAYRVCEAVSSPKMRQSFSRKAPESLKSDDKGVWHRVLLRMRRLAEGDDDEDDGPVSPVQY